MLNAELERLTSESTCQLPAKFQLPWTSVLSYNCPIANDLDRTSFPLLSSFATKVVAIIVWLPPYLDAQLVDVVVVPPAPIELTLSVELKISKPLYSL